MSDNNMILNVRGGAYSCCGGDDKEDKEMAIIGVIVSVVIVLLILGLIIGGIWWIVDHFSTDSFTPNKRYENMWNNSQYDRRVTLNRMAVVDDRPGHTFKDHQHHFKTDTKGLLAPGYNLSSNATNQRERMTQYDRVQEIRDVKKPHYVGHKPTTSDDQLELIIR